MTADLVTRWIDEGEIVFIGFVPSTSKEILVGQLKCYRPEKKPNPYFSVPIAVAHNTSPIEVGRLFDEALARLQEAAK